MTDFQPTEIPVATLEEVDKSVDFYLSSLIDDLAAYKKAQGQHYKANREQMTPEERHRLQRNALFAVRHYFEKCLDAIACSDLPLGDTLNLMQLGAADTENGLVAGLYPMNEEAADVSNQVLMDHWHAQHQDDGQELPADILETKDVLAAYADDLDDPIDVDYVHQNFGRDRPVFKQIEHALRTPRTIEQLNTLERKIAKMDGSDAINPVRTQLDPANPFVKLQEAIDKHRYQVKPDNALDALLGTDAPTTPKLK